MTNYEKVENLLDEYRELDIEIKGLEYQIKIEGVKGVCYEGRDMPTSKSISSSIENELNKIEQLKNDKIYLEIKKEAIDNMLRVLDPTEFNIIKLRYFDKLFFKQIGDRLNMHENSVVNKRKVILDKKIIPYAIRHKLI